MLDNFPGPAYWRVAQGRAPTAAAEREVGEVEYSSASQVMKGRPWEVHVGGNFVMIGEVGFKEESDREHYLGVSKAVARMQVDRLVGGQMTSSMRRAVRLAREIVALHNQVLEKV